MQFSILTTLVGLLAIANAAPNALPEVETSEVAVRTTAANINEAEVFSFQAPASCKILSCIDVIGQAVCIVNAIDDGDYKGILKCAKKKELCGCAGCYDKLGDFLDKYGIC
ncbi:hypothetical protein OQA88_5866 [Cercophora sp. LCS_1]